MIKPDKTFIIPTVTNIGGLRRCIKTIYEYHEPGSFRIIVINNSENDLEKELKDYVHLYLRPYYNLGFSKSMNQGLFLTKYSTMTPYAVICNDDVEFIHKDWWGGILETFERQNAISPQMNMRGVACVNPASVCDRNEKPRLPYKEKFTDADYKFLLDKHNNGQVIDTICMWCTVIPIEMLDIVGYLREKFYPGGGEDYDWNIRAYMLKYRCLGTFNSWAWHWWGKTKDSVPAKSLPQKENLRWNNLAEIWGKDKDLFGRGGRSFMGPKDSLDITPL